MKVLIIADDVNILSALEAKLSVLGVTVATSKSLASLSEIITFINIYQADHIITDLLFSRVNGFDLLRAIKEAQEESRVNIFVYTDLKDQESRQRAINLGANFYFTKNDLSLDQFIEKFKKIIMNKVKSKLIPK